MRTKTMLVSAVFSLGAGCGGGISTYDDTAEENVQTPSIVLEDPSLDIGIADDIGVRLVGNITIQNVGQAPLNISGVAVDAPFSTGLTSLTVNPGASTQLSVNYDPTEYVNSSEVLTISSDDPDRPSVEVTLVGAVLLDGDGDGFERSEAGGDDCDDEDAMVYPGADEVYYDGIDQNCDGLNDYDQDLDGYEAEYYGGDDCNDLRDWIHPGAEDDFYDGVDSNCDGADDWDADEDGFASEALGKGRDCDDSDDGVYPGAPERLNGLLDNCNSNVIDRQIRAAGADYGFTGSGNFEGAGMSMAAGDLDNDGLADVFVGAPYEGSTSASYGTGGVAILLSGSGMLANGSEIWDAWNSIEGASSKSGLGAGLAYLDADFSGTNSAAVGSLVLGAPGENNNGGAIYVVPGDDIAASGDLDDTTLHIKGSTAYGYEVGREIVDNLDLDGDGQDDLLFGYSSLRRAAESSSSYSSVNGTSRIGLEYGASGVTGTVNLSSVDARWHTNTRVQYYVGSSGSYPYSVYQYADYPVANELSGGGDLNGDGYDDWVFGNPLKDTSSLTDSGVVWTLWGQASEYRSLGSSFEDDASTVAAGGSSRLRVGSHTGILPDMDGDGKDELFWWQRDSAQQHDEIHVMSGADVSSGGMLDASDAIFTLEYWMGSLKSMASIGDWDGDDVPEWAVYSGTNRIHIYPGAGLSGTYLGGDPVLASLQAKPDDSNVDFGESMLTADIDGNGTPDWFVGDPSFEGDIDANGTADKAAGAVYLFLNNGL